MNRGVRTVNLASIPALGEAETRTHVTLLLIGAELGETDSDYGKLILTAREQLKRPYGNARRRHVDLAMP